MANEFDTDANNAGQSNEFDTDSNAPDPGLAKSAVDVAESVTSNPIGRLLGHGAAMLASNFHRDFMNGTKEENDAIYHHVADAVDKQFSPSTPAGKAATAILSHLVSPLTWAVRTGANAATDDPVKQDAIQTGVQTLLLGLTPRAAKTTVVGGLKATAAVGETVGQVVGAVAGGLKAGPFGAMVGFDKGGWLGGKIGKAAQAGVDAIQRRSKQAGIDPNAPVQGPPDLPETPISDQPQPSGIVKPSDNPIADTPEAMAHMTPPVFKQPESSELPVDQYLKDTQQAKTYGMRDARGRFRPLAGVDKYKQ